MEYPHNRRGDLLTVITYGSYLYGTNGPKSDHDFKGVILPSYRDLILSKAIKVQRERYAEDGSVVGEHDTMPPNGWESELTPVQKFVHDYLGGQAYAVELVFAVIQGRFEAHLPPPATDDSKRWHRFAELCKELGSERFHHKNVNGMVGFAVKQTMDYVHRGERLNAAKQVLDVLQRLLNFHGATAASPNHVRLDSAVSYMQLPNGDRAEAHELVTSEFDHGLELKTETLLDVVARETGLELGTSTNQTKAMRTLKLNGREYLETTALPHLINAVQKLVDQYGERSTKASTIAVDWKSLSHAVRVYQQVEEYLQTGFITFPRSNAQLLKAIKDGQAPLSSVRDLLRDLDANVMDLVESSKLPSANDLREQADKLLFDWLAREYEDFGANLHM